MMDHGFARRLKYKELAMFTDNFSEENFVGIFQFGKVYRAKFQRVLPQTDDVMVKIWEVPKRNEYFQGVNLAGVMYEFVLLKHERLTTHPGMIDLLGFCWDGEHLGALYNFNPMDTVHNLIPKDSFTWLQRIKVALGFSRLLKFLHAGNSAYNPFLVRNIAAAHILVDELFFTREYNPKLHDFGMITGGIFPDRVMYECNGCYGYVDPNIGYSNNWSEKSDVFAFRVVLLNLITKRVDTEEEEDRRSNAPLLYSWAWGLFESCESENGNGKFTLSLVDQNLTLDPDFSLTDGHEITDLAMKCINRIADERPTMKQVVKSLLKLQVIKKHADFLGLASKL